MAVVPSGRDDREEGGRRPVAFLRSRDHFSLRPDRKPVGVAQAGGERFGGLSIRGDAPDAKLARGKIESALGIGFQSRQVVVTTHRGLVCPGITLVKIGLAIMIQIAQPGQLIPSEDMDIAIDDLQSQGLTQAAGETPPAEFVQRGINAADNPDLAFKRAESGIAIRQEIMAADVPERFPRGAGKGQAVHSIRLALAHCALGFEHLWPLRGPAFCQGIRFRAVAPFTALPEELSILAPRGFQPLRPLLRKGEYHLAPMAVKTMIGETSRSRRLALRQGFGFSLRCQGAQHAPAEGIKVQQLSA